MKPDGVCEKAETTDVFHSAEDPRFDHLGGHMETVAEQIPKIIAGIPQCSGAIDRSIVDRVPDAVNPGGPSGIQISSGIILQGRAAAAGAINVRPIGDSGDRRSGTEHIVPSVVRRCRPVDGNGKEGVVVAAVERGSLHQLPLVGTA